MSRWFFRLGLILLGVVAFPRVSPAPLIYVPGEGWIYEPVGSEGKWQRPNAREQYAVAKEAFDKQDYSTASRAAHRVVRVWPLSDFAPQAQYLVGRCDEARRLDERAFKAYQTLLTSYPKVENYEEVLKRQYDIAIRFLEGQRFRLWGFIPTVASMDKTAEMFSKIFTNGPYSEIGPQALLGVGSAREKQKNYPQAVKAYEEAADLYNANDQLSAEALYRTGLAYQKQARRAEYDQGTAARAIATFTDFATLHPSDPRVAQTGKVINELKSEQARGHFEIARYYESNRRWEAARIYYNETVAADPQSQYAETARRKIEELNQRLGSTNRPPAQSLTGSETPIALPADAPVPTTPAATPRQEPVRPTPAAAEPARAAATQPPSQATTAAQPSEARGYRLGPTGGRIAGAESIQVLPFENKTMEPRLTDALTTALRRVLQQDGTYRLRTDGEADLILSGSITDYKRTELTLTSNDLLSVRDYQVFLTAQVKLVARASGEVVLEKPFTGWTIMRLGNDLPSLERQTVPELAGELARNISAAIVEGTW